MSLVNVERLREIAEVEFADIVAEIFLPDANELRILLTNDSFVDVWFSLKVETSLPMRRFACHAAIGVCVRTETCQCHCEETILVDEAIPNSRLGDCFAPSGLAMTPSL